MRPLYLIFPVLVAGCATQDTIAPKPIASTALTSVVDPHVVVTRYELGSYRYPQETRDSSGPAVFRSTRISGNTVPVGTDARSLNVPASFDPLPPSDELSAELSAQRDITARIRAAQEVIFGLERQMRAQYGTLVTQTEETLRLRAKLETERANVQRLEAQLRNQPHTATETPAVAQAAAQNSSSSQEVKW
jgi:hypothetical protein